MQRVRMDLNLSHEVTEVLVRSGVDHLLHHVVAVLVLDHGSEEGVLLTHLSYQSAPLLTACIAHTLLNNVAETRFYFLHYIQLALFCLLFCILEGSFCLGSSEVNGCAFYWPSNFCSLVTASSWL